MPPVDPHQLLKALGSLLTPTGGIKGISEARRIASLMKDAQKLVSRCVYISILRATENEEVLQWFVHDGMWNTLNQWLQEAKDSDNTPFLLELLKAYKQIPVTVEILKKNSAAKSIKQLSKASDSNLQILADTIVKDWMKKIKVKPANSDETSPAEKKKKKHRDGKEPTKDMKDPKENSKTPKEVKKSDETNQNHHQRHAHKHSEKPEKTDSDTSTVHSSEKKPNSTVLSSEKKLSLNTVNDVPKSPPPSTGDGDKDNEKPSLEHSPLSLKIHINKADNSYKVERTFGALEEEKKKAKTVKVRPQKFRSIGVIEDAALPPPKKKPSAESQKPGQLNPKRTSTTRSEEPPEKKIRPFVNTAIASSLASSSMDPSNSNDSTPSPLSPTEIHGKIKIIPPPRPLKSSSHVLQDSSGFMNALIKPAPLRKRKKTSISGPSTTTSATKATPTSPTTSSASTSTSNSTSSSSQQKAPAVPSFYRDTLATPEKEPLESGSRTPSPVDELETEPNINQDSTNTDDADVKSETSEADTATDQAAPSEESADAKPGLVRKKRKRKTVSWVDDSCLQQIFYFEMDEFERENVNRPKDFNLTKKEEMMKERMAMQHGKRLINDGMVETIDWYRPQLTEGLNILTEPGSESNEKEVQRIREQGVLQALFFSKDMLPDTPSEPDLETIERTEPKLIPLEDSTSENIEELHYTYDNTEVSNKVIIAPAANTQSSNNGNSNLSTPLPPELINLLHSLTQGQNVNQHAIPGSNNNLMQPVNTPPFIPELGPLLAALNSEDPKKQEEATQKLRTLLEPYKDQLPGLLMKHNMGNMNPLNPQMNAMNPQMNYGLPPPPQQQGGVAYFVPPPGMGTQNMMGGMGMPQGNMGPQQGGMGMNMQQGGMMGPQQGNMGMQQGGMMGQNQGGMMSPQQGGMIQHQGGNMVMHQGGMGPQHGNMGMQQGGIGMQQGNMGPNQGNMGPNQGNMGPNQGNMGPNQGNMGPNQGNMGPNQGNMGMQQGGMGGVGGLLGAAPPGFQPLQQPQNNMGMQQGGMRNQHDGFKGQSQNNDQEWDDNYRGDSYRDDRRPRGRGRGRGGFSSRGRGPSRGRREREKTVCFHFMGGGCRFGSTCSFIHPSGSNARS